jgi:hypothetical protein
MPFKIKNESTCTPIITKTNYKKEQWDWLKIPELNTRNNNTRLKLRQLNYKYIVPTNKISLDSNGLIEVTFPETLKGVFLVCVNGIKVPESEYSYPDSNKIKFRKPDLLISENNRNNLRIIVHTSHEFRGN